MKILWLCNARFSTDKLATSGGWLAAMAYALVNSGKCNLINATFQFVPNVVEEECGGIKQYLIPLKHNRFNLNKWMDTTGKIIHEIEEKEDVDIVHIWGTENLWGMIYKTGHIRCKTLLDMQGLVSEYVRYFYGGLTFKELIRCVHARELLYRFPLLTVYGEKRNYIRQGKLEVETIRSINDISTQSEWIRNQIRTINPKSRIYNTGIILRDEFYKSKKWEFRECGDSPVIYSSASGSLTYKGMHILLRCVAVLKKKYPNVQLHVAGNYIQGNSFNTPGYSKFLLSLINELGIKNNVRFLGPCTADIIVGELQSCNVCVVPSFIETYCLAFAEAMMVGTPVVCSYAGAMHELAVDGEEALFYNSMDYVECAAIIDRLLQDNKLSITISEKARLRRMEDNNPEAIVSQQIANYETLLNKKEV